MALSLFRTQKITEKFNLEFRAEAFNAFNFVNYDDPNTGFYAERAGRKYQSELRPDSSSLPARRIQFGLRLSF